MRQKKSHRKSVVAAISLALVAGALVVGSPAQAHDTCGGDANGPYVAGSNVEGRASYICQSQHDRLRVTGCIQKKVSGVWDEKACTTNDTGTNANQSIVNTRPNFSCSSGEWRTVSKYGAAWNNAGQLQHEQNLNEISPVINISC
ncbi:MAG TPA: hypothetical protein VHN37_06755 [Actinomycetota bacterium]|nr:hypothetical protein [Actinomycetota bacterium]